MKLSPRALPFPRSQKVALRERVVELGGAGAVAAARKAAAEHCTARFGVYVDYQPSGPEGVGAPGAPGPLAPVAKA